jgi:hypothetical protein
MPDEEETRFRLVCLDEKPVTLHVDVRPASPAVPRREAMARKGVPFRCILPLCRFMAACGTRRRFHTSGGPPVTANDNSLPVTRRSGSQRRQVPQAVQSLAQGSLSNVTQRVSRAIKGYYVQDRHHLRCLRGRN